MTTTAEQTITDRIIAAGDEIENRDVVSLADVKDMLQHVLPDHLASVLDGPQSDADLRQQALAIASLRRRARRLQSDIEERIRNAEFNGRELRRRRDIECAELREQYDQRLDVGDAIGADKKLEQIRQARADLVNIAKNIEAADTDVAELAERQEAVRLEALQLWQVTLHLFRFAEALHGGVSQVNGDVGQTAAGSLRKLDRVIQEAQKDAAAILSE